MISLFQRLPPFVLVPFLFVCSGGCGFVLHKSRTETNCDYVVFFKDANHTERWGEERYSGRDGGENWPGCGRRPPLEVMAQRVLCVQVCVSMFPGFEPVTWG